MTSNPLSSDFSYKKYSLEQLDNWVNDALNCEDLSPQDIYDTIVKCVDESVEYHKKHLTKSVELLSLLKGHRPVDFETTQSDWNDFWEETYYPEEHQQYTSGAERYPAAYVYTDEEISKEQWAHPESSLYKHLQYTEEELNAMCDAAEDKEKCREYNLREAEYYTKRAELDAKQDKVIKWQLPVQVDELSGDCFVEFPDDLLKSANLKEGDQVEWVDKGDGSYLLIKT
jgi:hypothetical protein